MLQRHRTNRRNHPRAVARSAARRFAAPIRRGGQDSSRTRLGSCGGNEAGRSRAPYFADPNFTARSRQLFYGAGCSSLICEIGGGSPLMTTSTTVVRSKNRSEEHTSELQSLMRISYAVFCLKYKNTRYSN